MCGKYRKLKTYHRKFDYEKAKVCHECTKLVDIFFNRRKIKTERTLLHIDNKPISDIVEELKKFSNESYIESENLNSEIYVCCDRMETDEELIYRLKREGELMNEWIEKQKREETIKEYKKQKTELLKKLSDIEYKIRGDKK